MPPTHPPETAAARLRADRDRFVALAFSWADILLELDARGRVAFVAGATEALAGLTASDVLGRRLPEMIAPADRPLAEDLLAAVGRGERIDGVTVRLARGDRLSPPLTFSGYRLGELSGHCFIALRHVAPARADLGRRVRDAASGLYDARSFTDMVGRQLRAAPGDDDAQLSLFRLDDFATLRERLDDEGDRALQAGVGAVLRERALAGDVAARLGQDRYGVVHRPDVDVGQLAGHLADLARAADPLAQGCAVSRATIALDRAQASGEALATGLTFALERFQGTDEDLARLEGPLSRLTRIAAASAQQLKAIVVEGQFGLAFQPVINARNGQIHYYEALIDLPAGLETIAVDDVLAFAAAHDATASFDLTMLQKATDWLKTRTSINGKTMIAVNLSARSLATLSFVARIDRLLKENAWLRGRLLFEISELWRLPDTGAADLFIRRLREKGFLVCLDRFEVGARGFRQLIESDLDVAKIDGPALARARRSHKGKALLRALVGLSRELGAATVTAGVNDEEDLKFARDCGLQFVQGDLFGLPAPNLKAFANAIPAHLFTAAPATTDVAKRA